MRAAAAEFSSPSRRVAEGVVLDLAGRRVELGREEASALRDAAAARAGESSVARDVALLLERSLDHGRVLVLRRREAQTLRELADTLGLPALADRLEARADGRSPR